MIVMMMMMMVGIILLSLIVKCGGFYRRQVRGNAPGVADAAGRSPGRREAGKGPGFTSEHFRLSGGSGYVTQVSYGCYCTG